VTRALPKPEKGEVRAYLEHFLSHARPRACGVLALMLLVSLIEGVGLVTLAPLLELVGLPTEGGTVGQFAELAGRAITAFGLPLTLPTVLAFYVGVAVTGALLTRWEAGATSALVEAYLAELRGGLYRAASRADWPFFARQRASNLSHALTGEVDRIGDAVDTLLELTVKVCTAAVYLLLALALSPVLTLTVLACGGALLLFVTPKARQARTEGEAISVADEALYAAANEHLAGMKVAKAHGLEARHQAVFTSLSRRLARACTSAARHRAQVHFEVTVGSALTLVASLYLAFERLALPTAAVLMLLFLFSRLVPMLIGIQQGYVELLGALPAFSRVRALERRFEAAAEGVALLEPPTLQREMSLQDVTFGYEAGAPVLEGLNLTLAAGQMTAVVGLSGAGKSTLADLVVGLSAPQRGQVSVDGVALEGAVRLAWRQRIGYVTQDTFLFHDTVRANLQVVRPDASDEAIRGALDVAAADFVRRLPEGLGTVLGDRGVRLSGGERQRLALARALLREPALLVLDEATSALDGESEGRIQEALRRLRGRVTLLVIAHRLSTVRHADVIHVLEDGRLTASGRWETLVRQNGRFRTLCEAQGLLEVSARVETFGEASPRAARGPSNALR